jgi:hypothetical protein
MHLNTNVVLSGKYIVLSSLYDTDNYIMYLTKAPSLGEEFILTEFYPRDLAARDDDQYVTISSDNAEEFERKLDKFTNDCRRLMHITANRFWGVREVLTEMGTAFAVSKKPMGDMLAQFMEKLEEDASYNENMIDSVYETLRQTAAEKIPLHVNPDTIYAENVGSLTFMFDYQFGYDEQEMLTNLAKVLYCLITKRFFEDKYDPELIKEENKYRDVIMGILDSTRSIDTFEDADMVILRSVRRYAKDAPFREYAGSAAVFLVIAIIIGLGVAFGVFWLSNVLLG